MDGMGVRAKRDSPSGAPAATMSATSRTPHSSFWARNCASNSALDGAVGTPSWWNGPYISNFPPGRNTRDAPASSPKHASHGAICTILIDKTNPKPAVTGQIFARTSRHSGVSTFVSPPEAVHASIDRRARASGSDGVHRTHGVRAAKWVTCSPVPEPTSRTESTSDNAGINAAAMTSRFRDAAAAYNRTSSAGKTRWACGVEVSASSEVSEKSRVRRNGHHSSQAQHSPMTEQISINHLFSPIDGRAPDWKSVFMVKNNVTAMRGHPCGRTRAQPRTPNLERKPGAIATKTARPWLLRTASSD